MAADVRVVVNRRGLYSLFAEPAVAADIEARTRRVEAAGGEGMRAEFTSGAGRPRGAVITNTWRARRNQAKSQALTRALDAGRG